MDKSHFDVNALRIASPCSVNWNSMKGDHRKRMCDACSLQVYNVSRLTRSEVAQLVGSSEGRLCLRLYRRSDGTVLTKDCPVGLRAYQRRVARIAGAALASMLGLISISFGQREDRKNNIIDASKLKIERVIDHAAKSSISGTILDLNGAVVPGAEVKLTTSSKRVVKLRSDSDGNFRLTELESGVAQLEVTREGFRKLVVKDLKIDAGVWMKMNLTLDISGDTTMGVVISDDLIETISPSLTKVISTRKIQDLPY